MAVATARRFVAVEPRGVPTLWVRVASPVVAIIGAGLAGAVLLLATGHDPLTAYRGIVRASFGNKFGWMSTLISATPLILTAVSAAVAFRMRVWNIGQEGQLYLGAIAASGIALALGDHVSAAVALPLLLLAGIVGGAVWAALAAFPRAYLRTDEVISTLMLNFIALYLMNYLIFGSVSFWRDKQNIGFPSGRLIPDNAQLPNIWLRLHVGIVIAIVVAAALWWWLRSSRWGFDLRVIGDSVSAARYSGMNVARRTVSVLLVSGAIAGLAGAIQVSGVTQALQPRSLAVNIGYTGIVVAAVARLNCLAILPVAVLIAGLSNAGSSLQILGIPSDIVLLLQGVVLLLVAASEFFLYNRIRVEWPWRSSSQQA
ncbi:MAG TPA: ABC transporter permease [Actinomycetota bacterium]|jgi:simple sugar transport system permease protein